MTVFLRIGYEFDGPHNHYDPQDYKKAYIYLADKINEEGVTNAVFVWHSYASATERKSVSGIREMIMLTGSGPPIFPNPSILCSR